MVCQDMDNIVWGAVCAKIREFLQLSIIGTYAYVAIHMYNNVTFTFIDVTLHLLM